MQLTTSVAVAVQRWSLMEASRMEASTVVDVTLDTFDEVTTRGGSFPQEADDFDTRSLIVAVGVLGVVANGFCIVVICGYPRLRRRRRSVLIVNQTLIDLVTSLFLAVYYAAEVGLGRDVSVQGVAGQLYCRLWDSGFCHWSLMMSSTYNLMAITTERYAMVVYPILHKKSFTRERLHAACLITWLSGLFYVGVWSIPFSSPTRGHCVTYHARLSPTWGHVHGVLSAFVKFFMPSAVMIYMYARMVLVLTLRTRSLNQVGPVLNAPNMAVGTRSPVVSKAQKNLLKTFIIVVSLFVCCWVSNQVTWFLYNIGVALKVKTKFHFGTVLCVYINCCINPFVYLAKYKDFRKGVKHVFPCRVRAVAPQLG